MQPTFFGDAFDQPSSAVISPCERYRYSLVRTWDPAKPMVNWIMLNPSKADAERDDPTIRRCLRFTAEWGFGSLVVTNLYAYRATDPVELGDAGEPVGAENDWYLREAAKMASLVVLAWGNHGASRAPAVLRLLREARIQPYYLRLTGTRQPSHPLRLPADLTPIPWTIKFGGAS